MLNKNNKVDTTRLGYPMNTNIYWSENLCPYFKSIVYECRKLKKAFLIQYVWTKSGVIKLRRDDASSIIRISHMDDLRVNFPNFNFSE